MAHTNLRLNSLGMTEQGTTKHSSYHDTPTHSVLATRRIINGRDSVQLVPGDESTRVQVAHAVREGLLVQTGPGTYADVPAVQGAPR